MAGVPSRLARKADERGIKCTYIARSVGVPTWKLSRIAHGTRSEPWAGFFERIAGMLNCSPDEIRPPARVKAIRTPAETAAA